ncbi:unnamed protein product, partial [Ixodes persulcatus]
TVQNSITIRSDDSTKRTTLSIRKGKPKTKGEKESKHGQRGSTTTLPLRRARVAMLPRRNHANDGDTRPESGQSVETGYDDAGERPPPSRQSLNGAGSACLSRTTRLHH